MGVPDLLRRSPLFAGFDDEKLERLAAPFTEVEFPADQVLIESRAPGAGMFVICDGTVAVEAHGFQRELGPGEVVGEISLVEDDGLRRARGRRRDLSRRGRWPATGPSRREEPRALPRTRPRRIRADARSGA